MSDPIAVYFAGEKQGGVLLLALGVVAAALALGCGGRIRPSAPWRYR